jgi:hypothetical protein
LEACETKARYCVSENEPIPRRTVLELTCDGDNGFFAKVTQRFDHPKGFIAQRMEATRRNSIKHIGIHAILRWLKPKHQSLSITRSWQGKTLAMIVSNPQIVALWTSNYGTLRAVHKVIVYIKRSDNLTSPRHGSLTMTVDRTQLHAIISVIYLTIVIIVYLRDGKMKRADIAASEGRVILSTEFCKQMLALIKKGTDAKLSIAKDHALLTNVFGVSLFGKLIDVEKPLNFAAMMKHHLPPDAQEKSIEMNDSLRNKLKWMIERAIIITNANNERARTEITIENGKVKFLSNSSRGEVTDTATITNHPDVSITLDCSHLKGMIESYDKILFTKTCMILTKPDAVFMVAGAM